MDVEAPEEKQSVGPLNGGIVITGRRQTRVVATRGGGGLHRRIGGVTLG